MYAPNGGESGRGGGRGLVPARAPEVEQGRLGGGDGRGVGAGARREAVRHRRWSSAARRRPRRARHVCARVATGA